MLCLNGGFDSWFELKHKGKKAGDIHFRGKWTPSDIATTVQIGKTSITV